MTPNPSSYQQRVLQALAELGLPASLAYRSKWPLREECGNLVSIGLDMFGRDQRMAPTAAAKWNEMRRAAEKVGAVLVAISAFRSFDYQKQIIARKLAEGQSIEVIVTASALPGFSEHHTGCAIDVGTPGSEPLTEAFEQTPAFKWLKQRAVESGFSLSYPRGNELGVMYEPWHWMYRQR